MAKPTEDSWDRFVPVFVLKQEVYKNCTKIMVTTENYCKRLLNVIALIRFFWQPWLAIGGRRFWENISALVCLSCLLGNYFNPL